MKKYKSGIYETIWGNACKYLSGDDYAYDLDMAQQIPVELIDFEKKIGDIDD